MMTRGGLRVLRVWDKHIKIIFIVNFGVNQDKNWFALIEAFALNMGLSCLRQKWEHFPSNTVQSTSGTHELS